MAPKIFLSLTLLSASLTACGVLFPETVERGTVVVTKVETSRPPMLLDPKCEEPKPEVPAKPQQGNTLSKPAADFFAAWIARSTICELRGSAASEIEAEVLKPAVE